jgi:aminobutyraldehyde dehydrogenase
MLTPIRLLIDGVLVDGQGAADPVFEPATGRKWIDLPAASETQLDRAIGAATRAFEAWRFVPPIERSRLLLELAQRMEEHREDFAALESRNCGKPLAGFLRDEWPQIVDTFRFFAGAGRCIPGMATTEFMPGHTSMIRRDPLGVVGAIAPWNYPLMLMSWKIAPALVTGNTVVFKPSELTPLSALLLAELARDLFPAGVLNIVTGTGTTIGDRLTRDPRVAVVTFTGSTETGRRIITNAAPTIKRTHLELGGKAPVIVLPDADLEKVAQAVRLGGYYNAGQDCSAACRVYATREVFDETVERIARQTQSLKCGPLDSESTELGPLISQTQRDRVARLVRRSVEAGGADIVAGGHVTAGDGFYYEPTLLTVRNESTEVQSEEVFGPVVTVTRCDDVDDALQRANATGYGLVSSVWTRELSAAMKLSAALRFGVTWVNCYFTFVTEMPHGGLKQSGYGSDLSVYALEHYTAVRHVMVNYSAGGRR